jgi:hypothetical protein
MVNYSTSINKTNIHLSPKESINSDVQLRGDCLFVDPGRIIDHHCLKAFSRWEVIVCFADIGRIVDHHCLNFLQLFYQYQQNKQSPLT